MQTAQIKLAEKLADINTSLAYLYERDQTVGTEIEDVKNTIKTIQAKYVPDTAQTIISTPLSHTTSDCTVNIPMIVKSTLKDKQRRKRNIIVTGLPESSADTDRNQFLELCEQHLASKPLIEESDCRRLGKEDPARTTPRQLPCVCDLRRQLYTFVLHVNCVNQLITTLLETST